MTKFQFALLSEGRLHLCDANGGSSVHESRFAKEAEARVARNQAANGWKGESDAWNMQDAMVPGLANFQDAGASRAVPRFTGVASGLPGQLCYSMDVFGAGGLFTYDLEKESETRLMHRNDFEPDGLAANPADGRLAFSLAMGNGTSHLKVKELESPRQKQLTDGDSCDECPTWRTEGDNAFLYFHSTPIGRNEQGFPIGRGPGQVCKIGIDDGDVEVLLSDESYDFLHPRVDANGQLYVIRRKYELPHLRNAPTMVETLKDFALLPYRFMRMLFYFANFMSLMFVGKPLTSEMISETPGMQVQRRVVWGRALQTQKQIRKGGEKKRLRLVPEDWELVRVDEGGQLLKIATHVMAFDVTGDGDLIYSDGGGVYRLDSDGNETKINGLTGVTQIACLA